MVPEELQKIIDFVLAEQKVNPEILKSGVVYIIRGVPGSGKTTVAKAIVGTKGKIHSTDNYFYDNAGVFRFDWRKYEEFHDKNFAGFCESLNQKIPVVVLDNTNIKVKDFGRYVAAVEKKNYAVRLVEMPVSDPKEAAQRNTHGVPEKTIIKMLKNFEPYPEKENLHI